MTGIETAADLASAETVLTGYVQRRAWLDEERDRAIGTLYRAGWTDRAIAALVGCNHVTMLRWRTEAGIASRPNGALLKLQPETIASIRYLAARGKSHHAIALLLGIHRSTVSAYAAPDDVARAKARVEGAKGPALIAEPTHRRILELARRGLNDTAISRETFVGRTTVRRLREAAGIPIGTKKTTTAGSTATVIRFEDDPRAVRADRGGSRVRMQRDGGWGTASSIANLG
jgi:transposase